MKLTAKNYTSPVLTEGTFEDVFIEEVAFKNKRSDTYLRIEFEMYYFRNEERIVLCKSSIAFQGMNDSSLSTNRKATFKFNADSEEEEPRGLLDYLAENEGSYPIDYSMVDWGFPSYEDALNYLTGGTLENPEIEPINDFVKNWILNSVVMKGELIVNQFDFFS